MKSLHGPWTTAMHAGGAATLSSFWKRRMAMLSRVATGRPSLSRRSALLLLVAGAAACAIPTWYGSPAAAEPRGGELDGTWKAVSEAWRGNRRTPAWVQVTVADNEFEYQTDVSLEGWPLKLNPRAAPKALDYELATGVVKGIYRLEGD